VATFDPHSYAGLYRLGRIRLSSNFYMREFLYSEIAVHHGLRNAPDADRVDENAAGVGKALAWWIHDRLPEWSCLEFFATHEHADEVCFNIGWHEKPLKAITSWCGGPRNLHACVPAEAIRQDSVQMLSRACGRDTVQMPGVR
jgi:hypothetical protein